MDAAMGREEDTAAPVWIVLRQEDLDRLEVRNPYGFLKKHYGAPETE